ALVALALPAAAQEGGAPPPAARPAAAPQAAAAASSDAAVIAAQKPTYPMNTCIACARSWGATDAPLDIVRQGRLARVCNEECVKAFDAQAAKWFKVLDDQIIAAQTASYPLTQCPVSGEELGKKPKYAVVGTRLIEVCCGDCKQELLAKPDAAAAALAKVDAALITAQGRDYPLETCVVDDKPLGAPGLQTLYGVTLVRFCCEGCQAAFDAGPREFVAKVQAARKAKAGPAGKHGGEKPGADKPDDGKPAGGH
ncbi:MAG TPA: hypothetical protein VFD43_07195, partial [Planctomycetota bacterium]|nr:hypothetical protein [Planctomycetota bacterium]